VGDARPNFVLTIDDNDQAPTVGTSPSGSATLGNNPVYGLDPPFDATQASQRTQFLYKASELTAAGIPAGTLSGLSVYVYVKGSSRAYTNLYLKLGTTTASYLYNNGAITVGNSMTTVKSLAFYNTTAGWNNFSFDVPYTWDGTSNLVVEICYDNGTAAASDATDEIALYQDAGNGSQGNMLWQTGINCWENFSSLSGAAAYKPYVQFTYGIAPTTIESTVNSSQSQYLGPNADVYFYDQTNGQLMARIQNLSSFDYGCTQVVVDRAGTSATAFTNSSAATYLMDKTFHVYPTTNNPSGSYNITLYYTQAEVQGWQTTTGQSLTSIQLVKVPGQISQATPANPNGAGTPTIVTPTIGTLGSNTSLTYSFTNGFSGFGAGIPGMIVLPVTLLRFDGHLENNNALLNWSTSSEQNSAGFEVRRSADGLHFSPIGYVPAAGNSSTEKDYSYTDPGLSMDSNFYQLRSITLDGHDSYSKIVLIRDPQADPGFTVLPNPFTADPDIVFSHTPAGRVDVRLLDPTGRVLWRAPGSRLDGNRLHLGLSASTLAAGVYLLEVRSDAGIRIQRVIKK
jgi:hypothetical protein